MSRKTQHRGRGRPKGPAKRPHDPDRVKTILHLRKNGGTLVEIGQAMKVSKQAVGYIVKRWGKR